MIPRFQLVSENLFAALKQISVQTGYSQNLNVQVETLGEMELKDGKATLLLGDMLPVPTDETPIGHDDWIQSYHVVMFFRHSTELSYSVYTRAQLAVCDVHKAIMADPQRGTGPDGNANAINTMPLGAMPFSGESEGHYGVVYNFDVHIRTAMDDPYQP